jgi:cytochrome c
MTRRRALIAGPLLLACALALSACGDSQCACDPQPDAGELPDAAVDGAQVFEEPAPGGNAFACASCHALDEPAADGLRRVALPLGSAAGRPSFQGGAVDSLRDAVNVCMSEWMQAEAFSATDPSWLALEAYLEAAAGGAAVPAEPLTIAALPEELSGGDVARGDELFSITCAACHGPDALGTAVAPALAGMHLPVAFVAERVRTGGPRDSAVYEGLSGGRMPFWSAERLSDAELLDVIAFVAAGAGMGPDAGP